MKGFETRERECSIEECHESAKKPDIGKVAVLLLQLTSYRQPFPPDTNTAVRSRIEVQVRDPSID